MANNPNWKKTQRSEPKCIFIDLGAADGNTFAKFLEKHGMVVIGSIITNLLLLVLFVFSILLLLLLLLKLLLLENLLTKTEHQTSVVLHSTCAKQRWHQSLSHKE